MTDQSTDYKKAEYLKWRDLAIAQEREWHSHLTNEVTTWGMETIKHIALISLSGLAGVFVLISGTRNIDYHSALICAQLFALASISCVLAMYLAYCARSIYVSHQVEIINKLYRDVPITAEEHAQPKNCVRLSWAGDALGWFAAILVCIGGVLLFNVINTFPATPL